MMRSKLKKRKHRPQKKIAPVRRRAQPKRRGGEGQGRGLLVFEALLDLQAWQVAFVQQTPDYIGDLDCDGFIALSDLSLWQKHFVAE